MIPASPIPVGRFVPDAFQVAPVILNRAATAGCAGGNFTYMGEGLRLSMQLMAKNASGGITRNYEGAFAPFNGTGFTGYAGLPGNTLAARYLGADLSGRLALDGVALSVPWAAGVARLDVDMNLQSATAADGPFDGTRLGLTFSDSDGVALQSLDMDVDGNGSMDHLDIGATDFRAGRLSVGNAHGSELRDLNVPVTMQFFAGPGLGFLTHTLDNCTPIASTLLADADTGDSLLVTETCIVDQFGASGANACAAGTAGSQYRGTALVGEYVLSLKSPGAGKAGSLRVFADAPAWAEFDWISSGAADPVGIATFGIYNRNTDVIYQRELR
jgi:MSHA biogenesis protein MshQ